MVIDSLQGAATGLSGIILVDKPRGMTSFGVISRMRRLTGIRRIGHTGTLDPFADGLLVVCLGRATAAVQFMERYDKTYRVGIVFGRATDTQDLTGQTTFARDLTAAEADRMRQNNFADLRQAAQDLVGVRQQRPPMYSAVKIEGRPLYEYARKGQEIEREARTIQVYAATVDDVALAGHLRASLTIRCSKGTYIRTLADDLGRQLGFGAHAESLTRLQCGPFQLEQAASLDQLQGWRDSQPDPAAFLAALQAAGRLLPVDRAFDEFPAIHLNDEESLRLINGQPVEIAVPAVADPAGTIAVYGRGRLIAAARLSAASPDTAWLITERVLVDLADFRQS